jgi:predicted transcriptional regulator
VCFCIYRSTSQFRDEEVPLMKDENGDAPQRSEDIVAKDALISIRVDSELKAKLEEAARSRGQSLTSFMVEEASKAAQRPRPKSRAVFRGVPTFFRACCATAAEGGGHGYSSAAYELARHTARLLSQDVEDEDDLTRRLDELRNAWATNDRAAVIAWYQREFPRCIALVPVRRHAAFAQGFFHYVDEHEGDTFEW